MSRDQKPGRVSFVTTGQNESPQTTRAAAVERLEAQFPAAAPSGEAASSSPLPNLGKVMLFLLGTIAGSAGFVVIAQNLG